MTMKKKKKVSTTILGKYIGKYVKANSAPYLVHPKEVGEWVLPKLYLAHVITLGERKRGRGGEDEIFMVLDDRGKKDQWSRFHNGATVALPCW